MASNLPRGEVNQEEDVLIEAVSLLVQRQRDTDERTAALEVRLTALEAHLAPETARADERLALLRDQLEELRSEPGVRAVGPTSLEARRPPPPASQSPRLESVAAAESTSQSPRPEPVTAPESASQSPRLEPAAAAAPAAPVAPPPAPVASAQPPPPVSGAATWDVLGATSRQRFSLLLIAVGILALLYSAFLLIRLG